MYVCVCVRACVCVCVCVNRCYRKIWERDAVDVLRVHKQFPRMTKDMRLLDEFGTEVCVCVCVCVLFVVVCACGGGRVVCVCVCVCSYVSSVSWCLCVCVSVCVCVCRVGCVCTLVYGAVYATVVYTRSPPPLTPLSVSHTHYAHCLC